MLEELLVQARIAAIHQEVEAQRWARQWRAIDRAGMVAPARRRRNSSGVARPEAGLREGR